MSEELDDLLDISSIPMPPDEEVSDEVEDDLSKMSGAPAFKFAFVGAGQGGGRIAQQFWQYGYRRVCAVNTASRDLGPLDLPEENKAVYGSGDGAGGSPDAAAKMTADSREKLYNLMRQSFGSTFDRVFVTATAGGGTGAGSTIALVDIAHDLIDKLELRNANPDDPQVGVIVALPKASDGVDAHKTAFYTLRKLLELSKPKDGKPAKISPLIIIDNKRIDKLYPRQPTGAFWKLANHSVCSLLHLINLVSDRQSEYTTFDKADFETLLKSGLLVFGAMTVDKWDRLDAISSAIQKNLNNKLQVGGLDLTTGSVAGCIVVAGKNLLDNELPNEYLEEGFSMLARTLKKGGAIRKGVYAGKADKMAVYALIGGLGDPEARLKELHKAANLSDWDGA